MCVYVYDKNFRVFGPVLWVVSETEKLLAEECRVNAV
jgi:hypothetical protein